jgi:sugar phosphate isomerase/epimerase
MPSSRRQFLYASAAAAAARAAAAPAQAGISLAAWSFSGSFFQGRWKLLEMPGILRDKLGIEGLEHVNQFFENPTLSYLQKLNRACAASGVKQLLLMIDGEGSTAAVDKKERHLAAVAHRKWVDIAHYLGCHSVRCNMYGGPENWKEDRDLVDRAAETFRDILDYAAGSGLNVLVENHGRASSDPDILLALVKKVNHPKFGLLVDLGNWNQGEDRYAAVRKTIPYGRALSVKGSYGANVNPAYDMEKLMRTALEGGYSGWWAIEVTPRRETGGAKPTPEEQFQREIETVREVKAIVERVVFQKG